MEPFRNLAGRLLFFSAILCGMMSPGALPAGIWLLLALTLGGCGASLNEQSATADRGTALAGLESLRATATVQRARMQTTLDYVVSRLSQAEAAREFLRYSLISQGTDSAVIATSISQLEGVHARETATAAPAGNGMQARTATPAPDVIVTPPAAPPSGPRLGDLVMASGVDSSDCAIDNNPRFTPNSSRIYIVARAYEMPAGATIESVWRRQGSEVARFSFSPRYPINGDCIWFFIDQSDAAFTVGAWSVELRVNDESAAPVLPFQIVAE